MTSESNPVTSRAWETLPPDSTDTKALESTVDFAAQLHFVQGCSSLMKTVSEDLHDLIPILQLKQVAGAYCHG